MWVVEDLVEYYEQLEKQEKTCKKVFKGEQVECPYCKAIIEKTDEIIHCPSGCFTRFISPELLKLDTDNMLYKGKAHVIQVIFKDGHEQIIDYIEDYKNGILTVKEDKNRRNETPIYGEPFEIHIKDIDSIGYRHTIK